MRAVPIATRSPPDNVFFEMADVNAPLRYAPKTFHFVHARAVTMAVRVYTPFFLFSTSLTSSPFFFLSFFLPIPFFSLSLALASQGHRLHTPDPPSRPRPTPRRALPLMRMGTDPYPHHTAHLILSPPPTHPPSPTRVPPRAVHARLFPDSERRAAAARDRRVARGGAHPGVARAVGPL